MLADLQEAKDWLRIDGDANDNIIKMQLDAAASALTAATGINWKTNNEKLSKLWQLEYVKSIYFAPSYDNKKGMDAMLDYLNIIARDKNV